MSRKANFITLAICGIAFAAMLFFLIFVDGEGMMDAIKRISPQFMLGLLLCMVICWLFESLAMYSVVKPLHKPHKFRQSVFVTLVGHYYNGITPFATGGQPMQAYHLCEQKIPLGSVTTALLSKFIVYQFTLTVYSAVLLLMRLRYLDAELNALKLLTLVGFIVNTAVILGLLSLVFFKNLSFKIARFFLKFFAKIKLVKNYEKRLKFLTEEAEVYGKNVSFLKRQPLLILKMLFYTTLQLTVFFSISFVIYKGFGLSGTDYLTIISCQAYVLMVSSFVPIPGAIGAAEGSYGAYFAGIFGSLTAMSMFIWRLLTFYLPITLGLSLVLISNRRKKPVSAEAEDEAPEL